MSEEINQLLYAVVRKYIEPPLPIIHKVYQQQTPLVAVVENPMESNSDEDSQSKENQFTLFNAYRQKDLIFMKWKQASTMRNGVDFYSSRFFEKYDKNLLQYDGMLSEGELQFSSSYQGGNLFAVFKISEDEYDLVMQNDSNTGGYTQWFNFMIGNRKRRGTIKLRIINFRSSLYGVGMKPVTKSLVFDKNWKRSCYNVEYFMNQIQMQGRKAKYYKTLSFKYDFVFQNDTVQFCSSLPYSYDNLSSFIKQLDSSKLRVKYLGATPLKKIVTMLQIYSEGVEKVQKKAIVIMGRQHAGETPSSFIVQSIVEDLLGYTQQNQFLLSKYNFYIFPMVNVDGVSLGNYRCNLYGYDLNRNWHQEESKALPQIFYIKNQLRKIMKREPIETILDLHGHSTQMNSFFYGNTFGKYNMLFPFIASKLEPMIDFGSCSFTDEEREKSNTARVVLGNMIKQTGSAYTYEVSLFGSSKNGKKQAFIRESYIELAKSLILGLYKTCLQIYKEERAMKESVYLKEIRRQLARIVPKLSKAEVGSDDEAKKTTQIEEKAKLKDNHTNYKSVKLSNVSEGQQFDKIMVDSQQQTDFVFFQQDYRLYNKMNANIKKKPERSFLQSKDTKQRQKYSFSLGKINGVQSTRKTYLMNKLRIFGETFAQDICLKLPSLTLNADIQTSLTFRLLRQQRLPEYENMPFSSRKQPSVQPYFHGPPTTNRSSIKSKRNFRLSKSNTTKINVNLIEFEGLLKYSKLALM